MAQIKLRKLISKGAAAVIIKDYLNNLGVPVTIEDGEGMLEEWRTENNTEKSFPIKCGEDIIGWIACGEKSEAASLFLTYIINSEKEKKELASETLELYKEINLLYKLSEKLTSPLDFNMVVRTVLDEAMKHIDSTFSTIILINEETGKFEIISQFYKKDGFNIILRSDEPTVIFSDDFLRNIIFKKRAEIISDINVEQIHIKNNMRVSEIICAPLMIKNNAIGMMVIGHKNAAGYNAKDLKLFNTITVQAAFAIENSRLYKIQNETLFDTVQTLADTMERRDIYTAGHSKRVANYCVYIGKAMGMQQVELIKLKLAAMLHDIGKVGISDWILVKHDNIKGKDLETVKKHPEFGAQIIFGIKRLRDVVPVIRGHHERYDGLGYPDGLHGEEIPLFARIISVADAYDLMVAGRGSNKAMSGDNAVEELRDNAGKSFDPNIVEVFITCLPNICEI
jgi:HD-GYP domain-containing protein (c-di-GMP phosphodiesterase class II)